MGVYYYFSNETTGKSSKRGLYAKFSFLSEEMMIEEFQEHVRENSWSETDIIVASPDDMNHPIKYTDGRIMELTIVETWS